VEIKAIGEKIRAKRKQRGLSLRKFAVLAGVDHTTLLRLERGEDVKASAFLRCAQEAGFANMLEPQR
jgi:transcriptional regulator with XRE-family HTH domain